VFYCDSAKYKWQQGFRAGLGGFSNGKRAGTTPAFTVFAVPTVRAVLVVPALLPVKG